MRVNNVFLTGYFMDLEGGAQYKDFENSLNLCEFFLTEVASYNNIEVCRDYIEYDLGGETLDDILYEISGFSDPVYTEMLKDLAHTLRKYTGHINSDVVLASAATGPVYKGEFISFYSQRKELDGVPAILVVQDAATLLELNIENLKSSPIDEDSFTARAKLIFNNIVFHDDFKSTLSTVKVGNFRQYSIEFTNALKALHNAFPKLSARGNNQQDLTTIMGETGSLGRTMQCTVQGANKEGLCDKDFKIKDLTGQRHTLKNLNCEYHLKLNFDNNGKKLDNANYNRAYFGLPLLNGKKYIALLHLGGHYQTK